MSAFTPPSATAAMRAFQASASGRCAAVLASTSLFQPLRRMDQKPLPDEAAHRQAAEMRALDRQRVQQRQDVAAEIVERVGAGRLPASRRGRGSQRPGFGSGRRAGRKPRPDAQIRAERVGEDQDRRILRAGQNKIDLGRRRFAGGSSTKPQNSFSARKLAWPLRPMIRWSWTFTPSGLATLTMVSVIMMSACDGVGSPEG